MSVSCNIKKTKGQLCSHLCWNMIKKIQMSFNKMLTWRHIMTSHCLQFLKQFEMKLMRENVLKVSRQLLRMILYEYDAIRLCNVCTRIRVCESDRHWRRGACPKLTFTRQIRGGWLHHISQMTAHWSTEDKGDTPRTENWNSFLYFCSFKYQLHKKPPARLQGSLCEGGRLDRLLTDWQGGGWQSERPDKPTVGYIFTSYRLSATLRSGLEIKIFQTFYQPLVSVCNIWPEQPNLMNCIIYS